MLGIKLDVQDFLARVGQELLRLDPAEVRNLADAIYDCYQRGRFVFLCGNGGSGSNAFPFFQELGKGTLRREAFDKEPKKRFRGPRRTGNTPYTPPSGADRRCGE